MTWVCPSERFETFECPSLHVDDMMSVGTTSLPWDSNLGPFDLPWNARHVREFTRPQQQAFVFAEVQIVPFWMMHRLM